MSSSTMREKAGPDYRVAFAAVLGAVVLIALVALGGMGLASPGKSGAAAAAYQYGKKVTICHKGRTITVSVNALKAHKAHGDTVGPCPTAASGKQKGGKAKAGARGGKKAGARGGGKPKAGKGSGGGGKPKAGARGGGKPKAGKGSGGGKK